MTAPPRTLDPEPEGSLTHRQILTILSGLVMGMLLAALDQTVVTTAIKTIGNDLHGLSAQAWVTTSFLVTSTITAPLYGKLSDLYGRKYLFMFGIVVFVFGSALCGLAQSMWELAGFRAFQGLGAGGIVPLAVAVIGDIIRPRERARYQGYMMAVFAGASLLGPVLGGLFAGAHSIVGISGWRWIFYINLPFAAAALVVIAKVLPADHMGLHRRLDWWGATFLAAGLVPLLLAAQQGREWGWISPATLACYVAGAVGLVAFLRTERRMGDDALLPLRLFQSSTFSVASAQITIVGMATFGALSVTPLYLQIVKGASPTKSGLLLLPQVLGLMLASVCSGRLIGRNGRYKLYPVVGSVLSALGMFLLATVGADTPLWHTDIFMALFGIGLGLNMQSLLLAMQNAVPAKDMGVASACSTFFRFIGGTLGAAVFLSILFSVASTRIGRAYRRAAGDPVYRAATTAYPHRARTLSKYLGGGGLNDTSFLHGLPKPLAQPFLLSFSAAADVVFAAGAIMLFAGIALSSRLKEIPLRSVSGRQARLAEAREFEI